MTKEHIAEIRKRCEDPFNTNHARADIPALLEALSVETERADANKREMVELDRNSAAKDKEYKKILGEITAERDHWKARAEAMERDDR